MKRLLLLCFFATSFLIYAQGDGDVVWSADILNPKFNGGGLGKFYDFINKEFNFSKVTKSGKMSVSFTINKVGELGNIKVLEFNDVETATEIIRVLDLSPTWECALRAGKPFEVVITLPLKFNVKLRSQEIAKSTSATITSDSESKNNIKNASADNDLSDEHIYNSDALEKRPNFPGGMLEFSHFIANNYQAPNIKGLTGKVFVSFVINTDGSVVDIKVIRDIGYGSGDEAIRVLSKCPKWIPGEQNGKKVRVLYSLPINISARK